MDVTTYTKIKDASSAEAGSVLTVVKGKKGNLVTYKKLEEIPFDEKKLKNKIKEIVEANERQNEKIKRLEDKIEKLQDTTERLIEIIKENYKGDVI